MPVNKKSWQQERTPRTWFTFLLAFPGALTWGVALSGLAFDFSMQWFPHVLLSVLALVSLSCFATAFVLFGDFRVREKVAVACVNMSPPIAYLLMLLGALIAEVQ